MSKVLSAVFGIGIAVVVYVSMLLGIQAFYPVPKYDDFCDEKTRYAEPFMGFERCADNITVGECRQKIGDREKEMRECQKNFDEADEVYSKNFFIIASILGVIALITAFFLLGITNISITNISAGLACSGIVMILWAFIRGWESTDDKLKFVVGLIITAIVVALTIKLNKKADTKEKH